jgi:uncharacterized membrane protein YqiK
MYEILQNPTLVIGAVGVLGFVLLLTVFLGFFKRYYTRASADEALIRTGSGGKKVVIDRGIWVFPILHELARVSLRTIRKEIRREGRHDSLITQDNIRVNIVVEFYIKVQPDEESVLNAARSLGNRTVDEKSISELMEGKLTDVLRSVAANKRFLDLHQQRQDFASKILEDLNAIIHKNGFTLESVSITNLNQTPLADLDERDYFDAQGARAIVEIVERARQERNQIELESMTKIQTKNLEEEKKVLAIKEAQAQAQAKNVRQVTEQQKAEAVATERNLFELSQKLLEEKKLKEVETQRKIYEMEQTLSEEVAKKKAETDKSILLQRQATETAEFEKFAAVQAAKELADRVARAAAIEREKAIEAAQIDKQRAIEAAQIEREKAIEAAQIEKERAISYARIEKEATVETGEVSKQRAVETAIIEKEQSVEAAKVQQSRVIEQANLEKEVAIVQKLEEKAAADAKRLAAIALKEEAEQRVLTVQETAAADRQRSVTVIRAEEQAKRETIDAEAKARMETISAEAKAQVVLAQARSEAEAQRLAAEARANYEAISARGLADAVRIKAEADAAASGMQAQAIRDLALAGLEKGKAEAEAKRLSLAAENAVSDAILLQRTAEHFISQMPHVVREFMKPAEAIKDIKILQIGGVGALGSPSAPGEDGNGESRPLFGAMSPVLKALTEAGAAYPIIKELYGFAQKSETVQKFTAQLPAEVSERLKDILPKAEEAEPAEDSPTPSV